MRILVDATTFDHLGSGTARRCIELFSRGVAQTAGRHEFVFAMRANRGDASRGENRNRLDAPVRERLMATGAEAVDVAAGGGPVSRAFGLNRALRRVVRDHRIDVVHQDTLPLADVGRSLVCLHDLRFLHREFEPSFWRRLYARRRLPRVLRRVRGVLTVSETVADEIHREFGVPRENIVVVPNGVDPDAWRETTTDESILDRHGLRDGRFVLAVGHRESRKNLSVVVRAFASLVVDMPDLRLLLVGRSGRRGDDVDHLVRELRLDDAVVRATDITDRELPAVYRAAALFVMPSRLEGFGMPILEAMAAGIPVACSDIPVFREVAGAAAVFVDPTAEAAWTSTMRRLLTDDDEVDRLVRAGIENAARFSWDEAARRLVRLYDDLSSTRVVGVVRDRLR